MTDPHLFLLPSGEKVRLREDFQGNAKMSYTHGLNRGGRGIYSLRVAYDGDLLA